jgi:hypothetical protein
VALRADNVDARTADPGALTAAVAQWLDEVVLPGR